MEQWHADIGHVAGVERQDHQHRSGHEIQSLVTGDDRFRSATGARGEQQQKRRPRIDGALVGRGQRRASMSDHRVGVLGRVGVENETVRITKVEPVEETDLTRFADHDLTGRVLDVASQLGPATRGIDAHHHRAGHGRHTEPHRELGGVVHENSDVGWSARGTTRHVGPPPCGALGHQRAPFAPRKSLIFEEDRRAFVVRTSTHMIGERRNRFRAHVPPRAPNAWRLLCIRRGRRLRPLSRSIHAPTVRRRTNAPVRLRMR